MNSSWEVLPQTLQLNRKTAHLWRVDLNVPSQEYWPLLSKDEQERAESFRFEKHRRRFIVGRGVLRTLLGRYLTISPSAIQIHYTAQQKPYTLHLLQDSELSFNISHSHEIALIAFMRDTRIGVDVEHMRPIENFERIAQQFFARDEIDTLLQLSPAQRQLAFFHCWTRKEAYVKGLGTGLSYSLAQFSVTIAPGEPARLLRCDSDPAAVSRWSLANLAPTDGYVGALAVESPHYHLSCFSY